jgi:kynurenine formamidase
MSSMDDFRALSAKVRNWGRWGADDQLGTLNFIDAAARIRAAACVVDGKAFSLAIPLSVEGPQIGIIPGRENPVLDVFAIDEENITPPGFGFSDDSIAMGTQACTHWDGLCHCSYDGFLYNGYPTSAITRTGTAKNGIEQAAQVLLTRGVLVDLARLQGVEVVDAGYPITGDDLDAACAMGGVTVEPGDAILIRTGKMSHFLAGDKIAYATGGAGPSLQSVEWFHDQRVAAVATDTMVFEVYPSERDDFQLPIHFLHIVDMGLTQGQNWNLEVLADDCAADGRYTFLLSAPPEPIEGGIGAPVNPMAVK